MAGHKLNFSWAIEESSDIDTEEPSKLFDKAITELELALAELKQIATTINIK